MLALITATICLLLLLVFFASHIKEDPCTQNTEPIQPKNIENKKYIGVWDAKYRLYRITRKSDNKQGGWIKQESNLSEEGNCFIHDNAIVTDNAKVYSNAQIYNDVEIRDDVEVSGNARIYGKTRLENNVKVYGHAVILSSHERVLRGHTRVYKYGALAGNLPYEMCDLSEKITSPIIATKFNERNIVATDSYLTIDGVRYTYQKWWNFTKKQIESFSNIYATHINHYLGADFASWWEINKPLLQRKFKDKT